MPQAVANFGIGTLVRLTGFRRRNRSSLFAGRAGSALAIEQADPGLGACSPIFHHHFDARDMCNDRSPALARRGSSLSQECHENPTNVSNIDSECFSVLPNCHIGGADFLLCARGYPAIPLREFIVCRMVYGESTKKDFDSGSSSASTERALALKWSRDLGVGPQPGPLEYVS
jgi:hypothetical protein